MIDDPRTFLRRLFEVGLAAVEPARIVPPHLPEPPKGRTVVVGAGKAAAAMAKAVEDHWSGPIEGLVVTRYGHGAPCRRIEVIEAAHPVPDAAGNTAAARILDRVRGLGPDDLVLCLVSGGGSALLTLPAPGLSLDDKQATVRALLASGATIGEMNTVRKHLSAIKGGRLALAAHPARLVTLAISDVPGDDPSVIASGPTVADASSFADAAAVLAKYRIEPPAAVAAHLARAAEETPKPGDPRLAHSEMILVARPQDALDAAAAVAETAGIAAAVLGDSIEGESREVARVLAGVALQVARRGQPVRPPAVLLSGGETTVTVSGKGRGGRNRRISAGAGGGARRPGRNSRDCRRHRRHRRHRGQWRAPWLGRTASPVPPGWASTPRRCSPTMMATAVFAALGDLVVTGPTRTNVNDFRAILVQE